MKTGKILCADSFPALSRDGKRRKKSRKLKGIRLTEKTYVNDREDKLDTKNVFLSSIITRVTRTPS